MLRRFRLEKSSAAFTLIELLVVIGVLTVLAVAVVLVINPAELLRQGRDSTRLSDLGAVHRSLGLLQADNSDAGFGSLSTVYVSLPDTSATCTNLGLPSLPSGWAYACATEADYRKVDGNGWIPADLTSFSSGLLLPAFPIDPINTTSSGLYYTYVTGGSWEMTALFESSKHRERATDDGGVDLAMYEIGSDPGLDLSPFAHGLIGYWKIDEGSGTAASDSSGFANTGTMYSSSTVTDLHVSGCKIGGCASFDGIDDYTDIGFNPFGRPPIMTIVFWMKASDSSEFSSSKLIGKNQDSIGLSSNRISYRNDAGFGTIFSSTLSWSTSTWYLISTVITNSSMTFYRDGQQLNSVSGSRFLHNHNFMIGRVENEGYFNGMIDEVQIYNRALSATEIQVLYDATK